MIFRVPGPCTIKWNSLDLGVTKSGIVIRSTPNWIPILDDAHGEEPVDYIWAGRTITVECVGMFADSITTADLFGNTFGGDKDVGEHIGIDTTQKALLITERDLSTWGAPQTEPLPPSLELAATHELRIPLVFIICPDATGRLFTAIPDYIPGGDT